MDERSPVKTIFQFLFYCLILAAVLVGLYQAHDTEVQLLRIEEEQAQRNQQQDKNINKMLEILIRTGGAPSGGGGADVQDILRDMERRGGKLTFAYSNDPDRVDPLTGTDTTSGDFRRWVSEYLAIRTMADPSKFEPQLADTWQVSDDGLVIRVQLARDRTWHRIKVKSTGYTFEEVPFTADDVMFTWDVVFKNSQAKVDHMRPYLELLEGYEKIDDYTIEWRWKEPYFKSLETILYLFEIAPRHFYTADENGEPLPGSDDITSPEFARAFNEHWSNEEYVCGTGPYTLEYDRTEGRLVKTADPSFRGRKPYLEQIEYIRVEDRNTRYNKFVNGDLAAMGLPPSLYVNQFKSEARVERGELKEAIYDYPVYRYIGWNLRKPIFSDRLVRRALTHAVNRKFLCEQIFHGFADVQSGPFFVKSPFNSPKVTPMAFDLEAARALLDEAGWKDEDGNGVREKRLGGQKTDLRFTLLIYADSPDFKSVAETIQSDFRKIGIKLDISPVKWALLLDKLDNWDFDAAMLGWGLDYTPDPAQLWHSKYADKKGSSNFIGWKNERTDELIEKIQRTIPEAERKPLYAEFHEILHENQPYTWLFFDRAIAGYETRIEGVKFYTTGLRPCRDRREWWLPQHER